MTDNKSATSGASSDTSGSEELETSSSGDAKKTPDKHVEKLLKEKDNWKTRALTLETKLKDVEESELKAKENYKQLYETANTRAENLKKELESFKEKEKSVKVNTAIVKELYKFGLAPEHAETALKLFDRGSVNLDPDTLVVVGAEEAAKSFHEKHSSLNFWKKSGPGVNQNGFNGSSNNNTKELRRMTLDEKYEALRKQKS